jgi:HlyD family secretion protein
MAKQIFRAVALARMSSPDKLDQLVRVTSARMWIALSAALLILGTATAWGFKGRLIMKAEGKGVVVRAGNLLTIATLGQGQVARVLVQPGDKVVPGQLVAVVAQPEIADRIRAARAQLADMEFEFARQTDVIHGGVKLELASTGRQREAIEQQISATRQQIEDVSSQIPPYEDLLERGLVTRQQLLALKEKKAALESHVTTLQSHIAQLSAADFKAENSAKQTTLQSETRLADLRRNVRLLEGQLSFSSEVKSPYSGQVIEIQSPPGALVPPGAPILTLQPDVEELEVVAFVSALKAKEIVPNMEAQIVPASVRSEEHGFIKGVVRTVAEYPSTDAHIMRVFQNNALAAAVAGGPVHEVRITLLRDPTTPSGFQWSSKRGAPITITPATLCTAGVITREEAPISLVLPVMEHMLEQVR